MAGEGAPPRAKGVMARARAAAPAARHGAGGEAAGGGGVGGPAVKLRSPPQQQGVGQGQGEGDTRGGHEGKKLFLAAWGSMARLDSHELFGGREGLPSGTPRYCTVATLSL